MQGYKDLLAWQKAMDLVVVYQLTKQFPKEELYALTAQLHRAAVSIPSNIAEGYGRRSKADYGRYLSIAYGSLLESETQVLLAIRLAFISQEQSDPFLQLSSEVGRLLNGLRRSLEQ